MSAIGVGLERATRLLDAFGSVESVLTASSEELQTVEGIGGKIAEQIKWAVTERLQAYGFTYEFRAPRQPWPAVCPAQQATAIATDKSPIKFNGTRAKEGPRMRGAP